MDSVSIGSRINTRLDAMETEFREIQSSLTKNQIITGRDRTALG